MIDTHVHLWGADITPLPWLVGTDLPREVGLDEVTTPGEQVVLVTADAPAEGRLAEARAFSRLAVEDARVHGFVAGLDLVDGTLASELAEVRALPGFVGVRHNLQDVLAGLDPDAVVAGWRLLAEAGVPFDLCVRAHEVAAATDLLAAVPDLLVVVDHMAKPPVGAPGTDAWRTDLARLARRPGTWCKLSGLQPEVPAAVDLADATTEVVGHALEVFGAERCLLGSDRPITRDPDWFERVLDLVAPHQRRAVSDDNALTVYRRTA